MLVSKLLKCAKPLVQRGVAAESVSKTVAETVGKEANPMLQKAKALLAQGVSSDELLGVRGNIAVITRKAPYNRKIKVTSFYDMSGDNPKWLKNKYISEKVDYLPFGWGSYQHAFPKGGVALRQRADRYPEQVGFFDSAVKYVTRIFDKFGKMTEKSIVKQREIGRGTPRTVREEIQDLISNRKYIDLDPVTKPANGTIRAGNINGSRYHH